MRQIDGMRKSEVQDGASRRLAMAQATVDANARGAGRIVGAALAGEAEGDVRRNQRLDGKLGSLVDG